MSRINLTKTDLLKGKTIEPGWYPVVVKEYEEKPSKNDTSTVYYFTFEIIPPHEYAGVTLLRTYSEKAIGMIAPLLESCGAEIPPEGGSFDLDALKGRKLEVYNNNRMYEGRMRNDVSDFRPIS